MTLFVARDYLANTLETGNIVLTTAQKDAVRAYLTRNVDSRILNPFARVPDRRKRINKALRRCIENRILLTPDINPGSYSWTTPGEALVNALYGQVVGLDALQPLLDDVDITSITVIDYQTILYEKMGQVYESPNTFISRERMIEVIKNLAIRGGQQLTAAAPTADLAFPPPNVVRIHLTIDPVTPRAGAFCALRRGREQTWMLDTLVSKGMMDDAVADFLRNIMQIPASCIVGGEPSSGKTTLLEVMLNSMPKMHIALLEQSAELNPRNNPHISYFEVPPGSDHVSLATLTIDSLRKNVQVVVIGETRGAEAGWLLFVANAMKGILTTIHGRDTRQVANRMANNAQITGDPPVSPFVGNKRLAMESVASAFDFVIHVTQLADGQRIVKSIDHIGGLDEKGEFILTPVFTTDIQVTDSIVGGKQLNVRWVRNPDWEWPNALKFSLDMATLRKDVSQEDGSSTDLKIHRLYQQACVAADSGLYETALRYFVEALRSHPTGYLDAEHRLLDTIHKMGQASALEKRAKAVLQQLAKLTIEKRWKDLNSALSQLDEWVELRVVANAIKPLDNLRQRAEAGLRQLTQWYELRRQIKVWADRNDLNDAVRALRRINKKWFDIDTRQEITNLHLNILSRLAASPRTIPEEKLKLCYEMFGLVDAANSIQLSALGRQILLLEKQTGARAGSGLTDKDRIFLDGLLAMESGQHQKAIQLFSKLPEGYRQTDVFLKSLRSSITGDRQEVSDA